MSADVCIEQMNKSHAPAVAKIHQISQEGTFLTALGEDFLKVLYAQISVSNYGLSYVVVNGEDVLGFVAGTLNTGQIFKEIVLRQPLKLGWIVFKRALRHPRILLYALKTISYPMQARQQDTPPAELLALAIKPAWRNKSLGSLLVDELKQAMQARAIDKMAVTVDSNNYHALRFYERHGFEKLYTSELYGRSMEHLVCDLHTVA